MPELPGGTVTLLFSDVEGSASLHGQSRAQEDEEARGRFPNVF